MLVTCSGEAGRASRKIRRDETRIWRSIQPRSSSLSAKSREARKAKRSRFKNQSDSTFPFESKYPEINFSSSSLLGSVRFIPLPRTTSKDVRAMHRRISLSRVINDRRSGERSILGTITNPIFCLFPVDTLRFDAKYIYVSNFGALKLRRPRTTRATVSWRNGNFRSIIIGWICGRKGWRR